MESHFFHRHLSVDGGKVNDGRKILTDAAISKPVIDRFSMLYSAPAVEAS